MSEARWRIAQLGNLSAPWGPAGGVAKDPEAVEVLAGTSVGFIEFGSTSLEPRWNPITEILYWHNSLTGETFNSYRLENQGLDAVVEQMPDMLKVADAYGKPIIWNVVPVSEEPVEETRELVFRSYQAGAETVLLDLSCPTIEAKRAGNEDDQAENRLIGRILGRLAQSGVGEKAPKVFVRVRPYGSYTRAKTALRVIQASRAVGAVFVNNAWPYAGEQHGLVIPEDAGVGLSGPAVANEAARQTRWAVEIANGSGMEIVSCCGISSAEELKRRLDLGAVACSGTTFFKESKDWQRDTAVLLENLHKLQQR